MKFCRVIKFNKGKGKVCWYAILYFRFGIFKLFSVCKFIVDRTFYGLKLLERIFVIQSVSRDLNHSQGEEGDV